MTDTTRPPQFRVLHLSDLHVGGPQLGDQPKIVGGVLKDVAGQHRERPIDLVVFSGDLSWNGKEQEFALAREWLLDPLMELLQLDAERVVLVPGNHDVDRDLVDQYAEKGWSDATQTREGANALMDDGTAFARATARLEAWEQFAGAFYDGAGVSAATTLARIHRIDIKGMTLGVAALNSAWRASSDADKSRLLIGERQLVPALAAIEDLDLPFVAVHHPLDWLASFDHDVARAEFASRGVMVLCGHEHISDPVSMRTAGGTVVFSRAGSLFSSLGYHNAYSLIDIAPRDGQSEFVLRTWWPKRREFDEGTDTAASGRVPLPWPSESQAEVSVRLRYSAVVATLSDTVQVRSVLADRQEGDRSFDDLVVPPRFLPSRYREASAAISVDPNKRLERVDPVAQLSDHRVVVIAGEPEGGVSTSLYWILKQHFDRDALRAPIFMKFDGNFGHTDLERAAVRALRSYGVQASRQNLPPLFVALDDVVTRESVALDRLARLIGKRSNDYFALGCKESDYETLADSLTAAGIDHTVAFVAPFGRRELRELLGRASDGGDDLLDRVMTIVGKEALPRSPFVLSALVAVLSEQVDPSSLNESGVLGEYVDLLLSDETLVDLERLGMDKLRRERLLATFAVRLTESDTRTLPRLDAESYLEQYFRAQGWLSASPGRVIDSLIRRRILAANDDMVGFRHPALFSFFQGVACVNDARFAAQLRENPLDNAAALRHAAGLRRDDDALLEFVTELVIQRLEQLGEPQLELYETSVSVNSSAWLEQELEVTAPIPTSSEIDERVDHLDDLQAGRRSQSPAPKSDDQQLGDSVALLSQILRNTELSTNLSLKQRALRTATSGWVTTGALILGHAAEAGLARQMLGLFGAQDEEMTEELLPLLNAFLRQMVLAMTALGMSSLIASRHMEAVVQEAVADEELMSEPVTAFLLTILYCRLGLRDWPEQLRTIYARHRADARVAPALRSWALFHYRITPDQREADRLEAALLDIYRPEGVGHGATAVATRGMAKSEVLQKLHKLRASAQHAHNTIEPKLDPLDIEERASE